MTGLGDRLRRFLQQPGTASLARYRQLLPGIAARETDLRALAGADLAGVAREAAATPGPGGDAGVCAVAREAARRGLGERPHDVQVLGALAMLSGQVAEMATGEGKTLAGAMAAACYALRGRAVHVMAVNDYLARRDAEWMEPVYDLLGVTTGWIGQASTPQERRRAYAADIAYVPATEAGFDVLRDRLCTGTQELIAPVPDVVLIDEADSVLVDEAAVPLVLAGAAQTAQADRDMADLARRLRPGVHYELDGDHRNVHLTDAGARAAEEALGGIDLYDGQHLDVLTGLNVALHARALLRRDVDYLVRDGRVQLISPSRGRVARLQRWPDGLQAAVEAKEGLDASGTGEILDSITIQALVRRYRTACGMTATAVAAAGQFREFYGLEVAVIPPHRPCVRVDEPDRLYRTVAEKESALVTEAARVHATGRPVLIGTLDVAGSQRIARLLAAAGLECAVLNAKNDAQEAAIVAEAGVRGAITVSTQMAGRGTDIRLGGTGGGRDEVARLGGLQVIGTGRHATSRLDLQLRGRSGRQGDPGGSVFFVSLADELVAACSAPPVRPPRTGHDGRVTDSRGTWAVEHAQKVAENAHLEIHRNTWRYSTLIEQQRGAVLRHRDEILRTTAAWDMLAARCPARARELRASVAEEVLTGAARQIVLGHLDRAWSQHRERAAGIREGIHLRALGHGPSPFVQALDPLEEFNREVSRLFSGFLEEVETRSAGTFEQAAITAGGFDAGAADLKRPAATWTYVVQDNPFGSEGDRALRRISRLLRG